MVNRAVSVELSNTAQLPSCALIEEQKTRNQKNHWHDERINDIDIPIEESYKSCPHNSFNGNTDPTPARQKKGNWNMERNNQSNHDGFNVVQIKQTLMRD